MGDPLQNQAGTAAVQDSPTPGTGQGGSILDSPVVDRRPAAEQDPGTTEPSAAEEPETPGEPEAVEAAEEAEQEETDYLPTEQEKVFPDEVYSKYAKRYGYTAEDIAADPRLKRTLHDKINSDIQIQQSLHDQAAEAEPGGEEAEAEPEGEPTADPTAKAAQRKEWFDTLDKYTEKVTDPEVAGQFLTELNAATDPATGATDPVKFTRVMSKYSLNLVNTALPDILMRPIDREGTPLLIGLLEQHLPGLRPLVEQAMYEGAWKAVRTSDKEYAGLPDYNSDKFKALVKETSARIPGFDQMVYRDPKTRQELPRHKQAEIRYRLIAQMATGQKLDPTVVKNAVATGRKLEQEAGARVRAGQLGAGQSKAAFAAPESADPLDVGYQEYLKRSGRLPMESAKK